MSLNRTMWASILIVLLWTPCAFSSVVYQTGFEPPIYSVGNVDGQDGWSTDVGPKDRVQVRNDIPRVGTQSLWAASGGGGVVDTRAIRNLSLNVTGGDLTLSSQITFTTGNRSDWEFSSVFGTTGFLGGLRVLDNDEFVLETALASFATGVFIGGFQTIDLAFDFSTGFASAMRNGVQIASGVAFDSTNSLITDVAAFRIITPRSDAIALDEFSVNATVVPEPTTLALMGLGLAGIGYKRRQLKTA